MVKEGDSERQALIQCCKTGTSWKQNNHGGKLGGAAAMFCEVQGPRAKSLSYITYTQLCQMNII